MFAKRLVASKISIVLMVLITGGVYGQAYPTKPVHILTGSPGGGNDFAARLIAQGISGPLGQPVVVENRGSTLITGPIVAKAPPDGYTLLLGADILWLNPLLHGMQPSLEDFAIITTLVSSNLVLVVHPSLPVKSVKELIAFAKTRPRQLNFAANTIGSSNHLAGEMLNSIGGVKIAAIPYKGEAASQNALLSGEVDMGFVSPVGLDQQVKARKLRALAVTSLHPSALAPGLPTMASAGLPGFEVTQLAVMYAPAKTPVAIVNQLNQEIVRFLDKPETKEKFLGVGVETVGATPEQSAATMKTIIATTGKVIRDSGMKID